MSLKVWLPLTKDLRNQGLDNITVTTVNTNSFQNEGKLSNKSLDVSGHYAFRVPSLVKKRVFSCAFWYKPITDSSLSDNWRRIIVFDTYTSDGSTTGAIFRFESSYGCQSSSTTYCISIHNNVGEPIASIGTGLGETDGWNKWQHIAITADGTTLKCYRNGIQVASGNMGNGGMLQGTVHIGYSGNRPIGRLNDFRLYDHCLSPMEVKELAKGLILHYPLNRQGWGQENQLKNSNFSNGTNSWYGVNSSSIRVETKDGYTCGTGTKGTSSNIIGQTSAAYTGGTTIDITVSARVYVTEAGTLSVGHWITTTQASGWQGVSGSRVWNTTNSLSVGWNYISTTLKNATNQYTGNIVTAFGYTGTTFWITNIKLEFGDKATPWCPNSSDALATTMGLNGTTEYDCSGFCNNGTRTGTFTWTSDTPKYAVSTAIEKGQITSTNSFITVADPIFSVALWFKLKSGITYTAYTDLISFSSSSYSNQPFRLEICGNPVGTSIMWFRGPSGQSGGFAVKTDLSFDTWYHTVLVSEGNKQYSYYINGNKLGTYNGSANSWIPTGDISLGENKDGVIYESDFRVYATALSAADVKSLYQNCATIGPDGTIYGQIRS